MSYISAFFFVVYMYGLPVFPGKVPHIWLPLVIHYVYIVINVVHNIFYITVASVNELYQLLWLTRKGTPSPTSCSITVSSI